MEPQVKTGPPAFLHVVKKYVLTFIDFPHSHVVALVGSDKGRPTSQSPTTGNYQI